RVRVQALISTVFGVAALAGPGLGAWLIDCGQWQLVFWIAVPATLASAVMIWFSVQDSPEPSSGRVEYLSAVLLVVTIACLSVIPVQWTTLSGLTLTCTAAVGFLCMVGLVRRERCASVPLLPVELWRDRVIASGSIANGLASTVFMCAIVSLPIYLQGPMGLTVVFAG